MPLSRTPDPALQANSEIQSSDSSVGRTLTASWRDWLTLTKPEITFLVVLSALAGFILGSGETIAWGTLAAALVGVALTSAGGAVWNHYLERDLDAGMHRTAARPLPSGRISSRSAAQFGAALITLGLALLCPLTNPLTGVLAALTVVLYLFVYTPMKRRSTLNTIVGTIPGALPALGGWTAATGSLDLAGWTLFAVLLFWQIPHFFALAWMYRADYARGGFAMLPVVEPDGRSTAMQVGVFSILLLFASVTPFLFETAGWIYLAGVLALGAWFVFPTLAFIRVRTNASARRLLYATIWYVPILVVLVVVDRLIGW